jgi:Uncharacterized conserved protein
MKPYLTVLKPGCAEQTIERSKFIGYAIQAKTVSECEQFFEKIRKEHKQATHNVPAYVLGDSFQLQWAGDDGEPRGTSGAPIVHMLVKEGISDVAIVVTRYFGGIKLGTGGLIRAYTGTAKQAIVAAGLGQVSEKLVLSVEMDYTDYNRLKSSDNKTYIIEDAVFTEKVTSSLVCEPEMRNIVTEELSSDCRSSVIVSEKIERVTTPFLKEKETE